MKYSQPNADLQTVLAELKALRHEIRSVGKRLLPIEKTAEKLGISVRTIRNDLQRGTFPIKPRRYGSKLLWREEDIDGYIDGLGAE